MRYTSRIIVQGKPWRFPTLAAAHRALARLGYTVPRYGGWLVYTPRHAHTECTQDVCSCPDSCLALEEATEN